MFRKVLNIWKLGMMKMYVFPDHSIFFELYFNSTLVLYLCFSEACPSLSSLGVHYRGIQNVETTGILFVPFRSLKSSFGTSQDVQPQRSTAEGFAVLFRVLSRKK